MLSVTCHFYDVALIHFVGLQREREKAELSVLNLLQVPNNSVIKPLLQQEMVCGASCFTTGFLHSQASRLTVSLFPRQIYFPYFVMSLIAALINFYVIVKGLGGGRLPDCGEEGWRNFPRSLSFPPGAPLILQWLSPLPAISSAKYCKILSNSGNKPAALKCFLISPSSL